MEVALEVEAEGLEELTDWDWRLVLEVCRLVLVELLEVKTLECAIPGWGRLKVQLVVLKEVTVQVAKRRRPGGESRVRLLMSV